MKSALKANRTGKVLYTSGDVHKSIKHILSNPAPKERRVVLVAYIGLTGEAYLPDPERLQVVCCLQPGSTSALTLSRLSRRKAKVMKSERLHMKVYWSSTKGCVICSANVSRNALGKDGLKEAGVVFPANVVDIDSLLRQAAPKSITPADRRKLKRNSDILAAKSRVQGPKEPSESSLNWFEDSGWRPWKVGWWDQDDAKSPKVAKEISKSRYGIADPDGDITIKKSQVVEGDWLLCFGRDGGPEWMFVDFVAKVPRTDKARYNAHYPYVAVQVHEAKYYPTPPFAIDAAFKKALKESIKEFGWENLEAKTLHPKKKWLRILSSKLI